MSGANELAEIEQAVLACMASSPRMAAKVREILIPQDFIDEASRVVFCTIADMMDEGRRIDSLTLAAELRVDGHEGRVVGMAHELYAVASRLASVDHGEEYATAIRDESVRRTLTRKMDGAATATGEVEELVARVEAAVFDARTRLQGAGHSRELSGTSLLEPLKAFLSAPRGAGLPYPLPSMRGAYGAYERGRYTVLGGGSGDGKTTMAFQWVEEICEAGGSVCIFELEMTELQVSRMLALQGAGITPRQAKGIDPMSDEDQARLEERERIVSGWKLTVKCGSTTPAMIRAEQTRGRYDVLVVDHMHKLPRTSAGEYADITSYSGQLHRITRDLDCSVICLVQLKKAQADQQGRIRRQEPTTASLRGAGAMEEDADDVLLVWQERDLSDRRTGAGSLLIGKMRDGEPDKKVPLRFDKTRIKFIEVSREHAGPSVLARRQEQQEMEVE